MADNSNGLESRVAVLEADVRHIQADVTEIKADIQRMDAKIERLDEKFSTRLNEIRDSIASAKIWALLLYFAQSAALLGVMAHGFGWLK